MINGLKEWAAGEHLIHTTSLDQLQGCCLAIDAEHYIRLILTAPKSREPLLTALGGVPFSFVNTLTARIKQFRDAQITPLFVFNGLTPSGEQRMSDKARDLAKKADEAWDLYNASSPDRAVATFGAACDLDVDHIYRYAQSVFSDTNVPFLVAPYSATAQLAFMAESGTVDAIYGPTELLLFEAQRVVLDIDLEAKTFDWIIRQSCIDSLARGNPSLWIDTCLLAGSDLLPTFPAIDSDQSAGRPFKIRLAADLLRRSSLNGNTICMQYQDEPSNQELQYLDNFRRAVMLVQHHVITTHDGEILILNKSRAPNDMHAIIGQQLPDEVYYYVSRGAVGTRVLTWRTSSKIYERPPLDGGLSTAYQDLVQNRIVPQRVKALALLSQSLHRFYQHNDVSLNVFFGPEETRTKTLGVPDAGNVKEEIAQWHVKDPAISNRLTELKLTKVGLYSALESLADTTFAASTVTPKTEYDPVSGLEEIQSNALWRYLQLQGYVSKSHDLTPLGTALRSALNATSNPAQLAEPVLLGIELLRLNLLTSATLFPAPPYHGAPYRGSPDDQAHTLLLSRVACLGRLEHDAMGYTGPLSRNLLAYRSLVSAVRQSQRDMLDMSLCTMFLDGDVDRAIPEKVLKESGLGLPFIRDADCALGIAVKHYLDELSATPDPTAASARDAVKAKAKSAWFPHADDFDASLAHAFALWDALLAAVKAAPDGVLGDAKTRGEWERADAWLRERR